MTYLRPSNLTFQLLSNIYGKLGSSDYVTPETLLDIIQSIQRQRDSEAGQEDGVSRVSDGGQMSLSSLYSEQLDKEINLFSSLGSE